MFLLSGDRCISGNAFELHKECQVLFRVFSRRSIDFSRDDAAEKASSSIEGRILWFIWSCDGKLGVPLNCDGDFREPLMFYLGRKESFEL